MYTDVTQGLGFEVTTHRIGAANELLLIADQGVDRVLPRALQP